MLTVLISNIFSPEHLAALREAFPDVEFVQLPQSGAVPLEAKRARILFRCYMSKTELRRTLEEAPAIQWIHTCSAGFDQLLIPEIEERDITVTRSAASHNVPMAEFVLAFMFLVAKRFPSLLEAQAAREWHPPDPEELGDKTVGIVGAGAVGGEVAKRCVCLGMHVVGTKRTPVALPHYDQVLAPEQLPALLKISDFVVLACPLTPETRGIISAPQLQMMKKTAYLINVARGALIVEEGLIRALEEDWIAGACLDVFEEEPLPSSSPIWDLQNVIITPHSSYRSPHGMGRVLEEFKSNLVRFINDVPLKNQLKDPALGY